MFHFCGFQLWFLSLLDCINLKKYCSSEDLCSHVIISFVCLSSCLYKLVLFKTLIGQCPEDAPQDTLRRLSFKWLRTQRHCIQKYNSLIVFSVCNLITYVFVDRHVMDCTNKLIWQPFTYVKLVINLTRISGAQIQSFCHSPSSKDRFDNYCWPEAHSYPTCVSKLAHRDYTAMNEALSDSSKLPWFSQTENCISQLCNSLKVRIMD